MKRIIAWLICLVMVCQPVAGLEILGEEVAIEEDVFVDETGSLLEEVAGDSILAVEDALVVDGPQLVEEGPRLPEEEVLLAEEEVLLEEESLLSAEEEILQEEDDFLLIEEEQVLEEAPVPEDILVLDEDTQEEILGDARATSGTCGENLTWTLDEEGTLTISGTGEMEGYPGVHLPPWYWRSDSIKRVLVSAGVTSIGEGAIVACRNLTSVTLPEGLTRIEDGAFYWCESLPEITLPESIVFIGKEAFGRCNSLMRITIPENNQYYRIVDDALFDNENRLLRCPAGLQKESYTVPQGTISIEDYAFSLCSGITSIIIPDSVKNIGEAAFDNCANLTSIRLPEGLTSIRKNFFVLQKLDEHHASRECNELRGRCVYRLRQPDEHHASRGGNEHRKTHIFQL